jgi:Carbohydrate binding domain
MTHFPAAPQQDRNSQRNIGLLQKKVLSPENSAMRIIIKPLGLAILGIAVVAGIAVPRFIQPHSPTLAAGGQVSPTDNLVDPAGWQAYGAEGGEQVSSPLESLPPGVAGGNGIRIETKKFTNQPWAVGYTQSMAAAFTDKEPVTLTFWARSHEPQHIRIAMQFPTHGYHECWFKEEELTTQWKKYTYTFTTEAFKPKEGSMAFQTGFRAGWVELAAITLTRGN